VAATSPTDATPASFDRDGVLVAGITAALLSTLAFTIGGEQDGVRTGAALAIAILLLTAAFGRAAYAGTLPRPFRGSGVLALMTLFAGFSVLSVGWSLLPGDSYFDAVRTIAYTAILAGGALGAQLLPTRAREVALGIGAAALLISLWALFSRVEPGWFPLSDAYARLRMPFEYWNAVGAVGVFGLISSLWLGTTRRAPAALVAASYPAGGVFFVTLALSQSRGAVLAALICVGIWLLIVPRRLRSAGWLLVVGLIGGVVVTWAYSKLALSQDHVALPQRKSTGHQLGLVLLAMIVALSAIGYFVERRRRSNPMRSAQRNSVGKILLILLAISPFVLVGAIAVKADNGLGSISDGVSNLFDGSKLAPPNSPDRLTQTSSLRARYWADAFKIYDDHKLHGTGGNTYSVARLPYRHDTLRVQQAHGFVPQVMSDFGTIGLLLVIALAVGWLIAAFRVAGAAWRAPTSWLKDADDSRLASNALMLVALAFGIHSAVDWTWFMPGVAAFGLIAAGWVLGVASADSSARQVADGKQERSVRIVRAAGIALVGLAVAYAVYQPARAQRAVDHGYSQLADGQAQQALQTGEDAHNMDPASVNPYFLIATAQNNLGRRAAADRTLSAVAGQQPGNPDTWLRLADYRLNTEQDAGGAINALRPLLYFSPNNERGNALLIQAKAARVQELIDQQAARERQQLKRRLATLKRQLAAGARGATTP
jgi:hypothetical protein